MQGARLGPYRIGMFCECLPAIGCLAFLILISLMPVIQVIDAMEEVVASAGDRLIKLGDDGDFLFVIEKGVLECRKEIDGVDTLLKTVVEGTTIAWGVISASSVWRF